MMKKILLYCIPAILLLCACSQKQEEESARIAFTASGQQLSDSIEFLSFGFELDGDSIDFTRMGDMLPCLSNVTSSSHDSFLLIIKVTCGYDVEFSRYYVLDSISNEREDIKSYYAHLNRYELRPFEKIPFPLTKISSINDDNLLGCIKYCYGTDPSLNNSIDNILVGYHKTSRNKKLIPKEPQYSFMMLSRTFINGKNPQQVSFIYKDTVIPDLSNYQPLTEKELSIHQLIELK